MLLARGCRVRRGRQPGERPTAGKGVTLRVTAAPITGCDHSRSRLPWLRHRRYLGYGWLRCVGELDGQPTERVRLIADTFNRSGLETTVSTDIMATMWDKLLVNVATGALSGITALPYGGLYAVPECTT